MNLAMTEQTAALTGEFTYLAASVESSLYGNGKVFMRRDAHGNDSPWYGTDLETRPITVHDARRWIGAERHTLDANGFELIERPIESSGIDFFDHDKIVRRYYPQCAAIVGDETGARVVAAFDHNIRSVSGNRSGRRIDGGRTRPLEHRGALHRPLRLTRHARRCEQAGRTRTSGCFPTLTPG